MQPFPKTIVWRHRRENLNKCSLRGLESREDFQFFSYPDQLLPNVDGYLVLKIDAPAITEEDRNCGLLILDGTWRYAARMLQRVESRANLVYRSIPSHFMTAYPRRQWDCPDPRLGLASIEAIYIAYTIMGRPTEGLLNHYFWKNKFLIDNKMLPKDNHYEFRSFFNND